MTHDQFIESINSIQDELKSAIAMNSLALTPEEQEVIDNLPPDKLNRISALMSIYTPSTGYDIRELTVLKGLALFLMNAEPGLRKAWNIGQKVGAAQ